jgi:ABC-2 type transport system permease protein
MTEGAMGGSVIQRGPPPFLSSPIVIARNLREHRHLVSHFIRRDFKLKYHGSILGYGWTIIEPLVMTGVFYLLFAILSTSVDPHRPMHIMIGFLTWYFFNGTITKSTSSLVGKSGLIQIVYFPRELFIISIVSFEALTLILSLLIVIPMANYYDLAITWRVVYLPISMIGIGLLGSGIGFFTSILQARIRDVEHITGLVLKTAFFLSPAFWTMENVQRVPAQYLDIYLYANPMAVFMTMARSAFNGHPLGISESHIASAFLVSIVTFYLGSIFFMRNERKAVKYL